MPASPYAFGEFELDTARFELRRNGRALKLERIPLELLILLAEKEGKVVSRQEISERLWGKDVFVDTEHGINTAIRKIRTALHEDVERPRFLLTVPGKGYRFVAEVKNGGNGKASPAESAATAIRTETMPEPPTPAGRSGWWAAGIAVLTLVVAAGGLLAFNVAGLRDRIFARNQIGPIHSIAVLPLANLSGDASQDYFADGMTDELITALAKNRSVRVVSRTSVMQYKGVHRPLRDIARELGVEGIVEGSVERSTSRAHMTVQLIYAPSDTHLWAESYDRDLNGATDLPIELAQAVFQQLKATPVTRSLARYVSPEAHDAFLRGRYYWFSNRDDSGEWFRRAIELQPDYAAAWAGLAGAYGGGGMTGQFSPQEAGPQAESAAARALELDDQLADAHHAHAANLLFYRWDFAGADRESLRTIELDPNFAEAHHLRCYILHALNRTDEALLEQKKATELEPFAGPAALAHELYRLRRFDEALAEARIRLTARPDDPGIHLVLAEIYELKEMKKESVDELEKYYMARGNKVRANAVRHAYETGGYQAVQELDLQDLRDQQAEKKYVQPIRFALDYARLGMKEEAIHYLQLAFGERSPQLIHLQYEPEFDFLHSDPRYRAIVKNVGLAPAY